MTETYNSFDEIKDPKFRRTIEGLAKLYYDGDVNAALNHYNNIDEIMGTIFVVVPKTNLPASRNQEVK